MKKPYVLLSLLAAPFCVNASDLVDIYNQALISDPLYQQAISARLATREGVPISLSQLLPASALAITPSVTKTIYSGPAATATGGNTERGYTMNLNASQTVFDFSKIANLAGARQIAKQADATLNAETQQLIIRVAKSYFKILEDEDNLLYIKATVVAFKQQLDQVKEEYKVSIKTLTDVYTAQASYQGAIAARIAAENTLADDKENLRVITGQYYPKLAKLSGHFPLTTPKPNNIEAWAATALQQNWAIKSAEYATAAANWNIKQQFAGHLPTLNAQAGYQVQHLQNSGDDFVGIPSGSEQTNTLSGSTPLNIPIIQGGLVMAQTKQAQYQYQLALQKQEQTLRDAMNLARQSYLGTIAGISKIKADKQAIRSAISSLEGMKLRYKVGAEILFNVLDQQQKVFLALRQYASDRYSYVIDLLTLKQAAGTLGIEDILYINHWLNEKNTTYNEFNLSKIIS